MGKVVQNQNYASSSSSRLADEEDKPMVMKSLKVTIKKRPNEAFSQFSVKQEAQEDAFGDGYDENLIGDLDDQRKLAEMTEKERIEILFQRSQAREVCKKLKTKKEKEEPRKSRINLNVIKVKDALAGLKEERDKKKKMKLDPDQVGCSPEEDKSTDSFSSSSSEDEEHKGIVKEEKNPLAITFQDAIACQVTRKMGESHVYNPLFEPLVRGCFVRTGIVLKEGTIYKVYRVDNMVHGTDIYKIGTNNTDILLKGHFGSKSCDIKLEFLSNARILESEFEQWTRAMADCGKDVPSKLVLRRKSIEIINFCSARMTDATINAIIENKKKYGQGYTNFAVKKADLMKEKLAAEAKGDLRLVLQINQKMEQCNQEAKRLDEKRAGVTTKMLNTLNQKNRLKNINIIQKTNVEEPGNNGEGDDPWTKRKWGRPTLAPPKKKGSGINGVPPPPPPTSKLASPSRPIKPKVTQPSTQLNVVVPQIKVPPKPVKDVDPYQSHDFEIDLDI